MSTQNSRTYAIVVTVLLALAAVLGFFFWLKSRTYLEEKKQAETERQTLEIRKVTIEHELDSLASAYSSLRTENENLQGRVTSSASIIAQKESDIRNLKNQSAKDVGELRTQIALLESTKKDYEGFINLLRAENDSLKVENQRLTGENLELKGANTQLSGQVQDLAKQLEQQIQKTQSATFKATSFRVWTAKKGEKLTTKARRSREIDVSFDLIDVPEPFQGQQNL